jgi:hypothetical protein
VHIIGQSIHIRCEWSPAKDTNRLADLVHYIIWRSDSSELGATKLNKICWYADLHAYRQTGRTITGADRYKRLQFGPVPKGIHSVLEALEQEGKIARTEETFFGRPKHMFMALTRPNLSAFTTDEIAIVDAIAEFICRNHTATSISLASDDALWEEAELGDDILVAAGAVIPGEATAEDIEWARRVVSGLE